MRGAAALLSAIGLATSAGAATLATYANPRFGVWVDYPTQLLAPGRQSDNGDGREFNARHGPTRMLVWGSYSSEWFEDGSLLRWTEAECRGKRAGYKVVRDRMIAISCLTPAGAVLYEKSILRGDVVGAIRFEYPASERAIWDPVVRQVSATLRIHDAP